MPIEAILNLSKVLTQHQVHRAENERQFEALPRIDLITRYNVAEAYSGERYETKVGSIEKIPVLPFGKE